MKILLTSTSFMDTPGIHHKILKEKKIEFDFLRGPLSEKQLLAINWNYDGIICGDDEYTALVLLKAKNGGLKVLSKYGVGLDKINLTEAKKLEIAVRNCPGINHQTVAEHVLALLLSYFKNIPRSLEITKNKKWERPISIDLRNKNVLIIGLGKIGKEVSKRLHAFGANLFAYDIYQDTEFAQSYGVTFLKDFLEIKNIDIKMDIISLHCQLDDSTRSLVNTDFLMNIGHENLVLVNTSRAHLVDKMALSHGIKNKKLKVYLTDVWYDEPIKSDEELMSLDQIWLTPHCASRSYENVEEQAMASINNLLESFIQRK